MLCLSFLGEVIGVKNVVLDVDNEQAVVHLLTLIHPGTFHLKLNFKGTINDKLKGFYCSKYTRYGNYNSFILQF